MACFCSGVIPDVLAIICDFVMYIFVFMFTPTTGSLAAQCGMLPIEDDMEEDMELWASVGRLLPRSTAIPSTVAAARLFIFIGSPFEAITLQARVWMSFGPIFRPRRAFGRELFDLGVAQRRAQRTHELLAAPLLCALTFISELVVLRIDVADQLSFTANLCAQHPEQREMLQCVRGP